MLMGVSSNWEWLSGSVLAQRMREMQALTGHIGPPFFVSPER